MKQITIYTDGACSGNPGPGGWGAVLIYTPTTDKDSSSSKCEAHSGGGAERGQGPHQKEISGGALHTTNNRMEMTAALEALKSLKTPCHVSLHTDSTYLVKGMTEWMPGWKARGWRTADKKPVLNADLWQALEAEAKRHQVKWHWVKGHNGHPLNERADALATSAILRDK